MRTQYRHGFWIAALLLSGCAGLPMQTAPVTTAPVHQAVVVQPPATPTSPPVVSTPAPPSTPPPPSAAAPPVAAPLATTHARRIITSARHPADHHTGRPSRPVPSEPAVPDAAATASLRGHIILDAAGGQHIAAGDLADTLVYFVPKAGNVAPHSGTFTVFTQNRAYDPAAMAIPLGSTVTFANLDEVRHNEFSVTPGSAFNLGYQAPGQKTAHVFAHAGLVLVGCLVHRMMELDVLVVPTTFVTRVSANGSFSLHDLPPGPGTLYVWNPRGRLAMRPLTVPAASPIEERVELVKPQQSAQIDVETQP